MASLVPEPGPKTSQSQSQNHPLIPDNQQQYLQRTSQLSSPSFQSQFQNNPSPPLSPTLLPTRGLTNSFTSGIKSDICVSLSSKLQAGNKSTESEAITNSNGYALPPFSGNKITSSHRPSTVIVRSNDKYDSSDNSSDNSDNSDNELENDYINKYTRANLDFVKAAISQLVLNKKNQLDDESSMFDDANDSNKTVSKRDVLHAPTRLSLHDRFSNNEGDSHRDEVEDHDYQHDPSDFHTDEIHSVDTEDSAESGTHSPTDNESASPIWFGSKSGKSIPFTPVSAMSEAGSSSANLSSPSSSTMSSMSLSSTSSSSALPSLFSPSSNSTFNPMLSASASTIKSERAASSPGSLTLHTSESNLKHYPTSHAATLEERPRCLRSSSLSQVYFRNAQPRTDHSNNVRQQQQQQPQPQPQPQQQQQHHHHHHLVRPQSEQQLSSISSRPLLDGFISISAGLQFSPQSTAGPSLRHSHHRLSAPSLPTLCEEENERMFNQDRQNRDTHDFNRIHASKSVSGKLRLEKHPSKPWASLPSAPVLNNTPFESGSDSSSSSNLSLSDSNLGNDNYSELSSGALKKSKNGLLSSNSTSPPLRSMKKSTSIAFLPLDTNPHQDPTAALQVQQQLEEQQQQQQQQLQNRHHQYPHPTSPTLKNPRHESPNNAGHTTLRTSMASSARTSMTINTNSASRIPAPISPKLLQHQAQIAISPINTMVSSSLSASSSVSTIPSCSHSTSYQTSIQSHLNPKLLPQQKTTAPEILSSDSRASLKTRRSLPNSPQFSSRSATTSHSSRRDEFTLATQHSPLPQQRSQQRPSSSLYASSSLTASRAQNNLMAEQPDQQIQGENSSELSSAMKHGGWGGLVASFSGSYSSNGNSGSQHSSHSANNSLYGKNVNSHPKTATSTQRPIDEPTEFTLSLRRSSSHSSLKTKEHYPSSSLSPSKPPKASQRASPATRSLHTIFEPTSSSTASSMPMSSSFSSSSLSPMKRSSMPLTRATVALTPASTSSSSVSASKLPSQTLKSGNPFLPSKSAATQPSPTLSHPGQSAGDRKYTNLGSHQTESMSTYHHGSLSSPPLPGTPSLSPAPSYSSLNRLAGGFSFSSPSSSSSSSSSNATHASSMAHSPTYIIPATMANIGKPDQSPHRQAFDAAGMAMDATMITGNNVLKSKSILQRRTKKTPFKLSFSDGTEYSLHPEFLENYEMCEALGEGVAGTVLSAIRLNTSEEVAVKLIRKDKVAANSWVEDPELGIVPFEIHVLKTVSHPNIVRYIDFFEDVDYFYLVTELYGTVWENIGDSSTAQPTSRDAMENENLSKAVVNNTKISSKNVGSNFEELKTFVNFEESEPESHPIEWFDQLNDTYTTNSSSSSNPSSNTSMEALAAQPSTIAGIKRQGSRDLFECISAHKHIEEPQARIIFRQVVCAVHYLHTVANVAHRDIKDENVLVDRNNSVRLIDFGSCAPIPPIDGKYFDTFMGTLTYASPEIFLNKPFRGPETDVWALGVLLYTILFGDNPFMSASEILTKPIVPKYKVSSECMDILSLMLEKDASKRGNIQLVAQHPWLSASMDHVTGYSSPFRIRPKSFESSFATLRHQQQQSQSQNFNPMLGELADVWMQQQQQTSQNYESISLMNDLSSESDSERQDSRFPHVRVTADDGRAE